MFIQWLNTGDLFVNNDKKCGSEFNNIGADISIFNLTGCQTFGQKGTTKISSAFSFILGRTFDMMVIGEKTKNVRSDQSTVNVSLNYASESSLQAT